MSTAELIHPLKTGWKIRHKTLPPSQNVFGTNLKLRKKGVHYGWDLEASINTPVYAIGGPGKVVYADQAPGYGLVVMHAFPFQGQVYYVAYAHLSKKTVGLNEVVNGGMLIGYVGISGNADRKDPHLHLEFHSTPQLSQGKKGKIDPTFFFGSPPM